MKQTLIMLLCLCLAQSSFATDTARAVYPRWVPNKKVILGGQGNKPPQYIRDSIHVISKTGFDGVAMRMNWPSSDIFTLSSVSECDMQLDSLRSVVWNDTLTDNFIRMTGGRGSAPDWFNDAQWKIIISNMRRLSYAVSEANVKGLFLDMEPFGTTLWSYNSTLYPAASLTDVRNKVKERGTAFIIALQKYKPDIKIMLLPSAFRANPGGPYELLKDFADGILTGITGDARLIDANEVSYYWHTPKQWQNATNGYSSVSNATAAYSSLPEKARTYVQVAQATRYNDAYLTDTSLNRLIQDHIFQSFVCSDEYAWVYGEMSDDNVLWDSRFSQVTALTIDSAKKKYKNGEMPGFTTASDGTAYYPLNSNDLHIISPLQNDTFNVGDTLYFKTDTASNVSGIIYFVSYNRKWQGFSPGQVYKQIASEAGTYIVYAYSNTWTKFSNVVRFYVRPATGSMQKTSSGGNRVQPVSKDTNSESILKVYPNPSNLSINFSFDGDNKGRFIKSVYVFNHSGQIVGNREVSAKQGLLNISTATLAPQTYYYLVQLSDGTTLNGEFVKL